MGAEQPAPFHIADSGDGVRVASDGRAQVIVAVPEAAVFRRRAMRGIAMRPAAELMLPQVNALAGELLQHPAMPAQDLANRLLALAGTVNTKPPQAVEWLVVEVGDVRIYVDGTDVVVTREDLTPR